MSNPNRPPKEFTDQQLKMSVAPDAFLMESSASKAEEYRKIEVSQELLGRLDMDVAPTIILPRHLSVEDSVRKSTKSKMALAKKGLPVGRVRNQYSKDLVNKVFLALPEEVRSVVGEAMANKVYVDGGAECALGRLAVAYPKAQRDRAHRPFSVTLSEAAIALGHCGIDMGSYPPELLVPFPLVRKDGDKEGLTVNPKSDNGFPVGGKWFHDGAAAMCMGLAQGIRDELRNRDPVAWLREAEVNRPWLVAVKGKAKADYYSLLKVKEAKMRFYNVLPRQIVLNMQVATQVLERNSRNVLDSSLEHHTVIGISLPYGGADKLVTALQTQLDMSGYGYVHCGDDSWVCVKTDEHLMMFALDCSNFDLTQQQEVLQNIHVAVRNQLRKIDAKAADLWFGYTQSRLVVTVGSQVRRWKHGGPSGMPLQSKVNDMLMDVMLQRLGEGVRSASFMTPRPARRPKYWDLEISEIVERVGSRLGLVVRLEQYQLSEYRTIREALRYQPFLFIGYYFHTVGEPGMVAVHADVPRTMSQVPYPSTGWVKDKTTELLLIEALRLGSIAMNLGVPRPEYALAFRVFKEEALALIDKALALPDKGELQGMEWRVLDNVFGAGVIPSLTGLRNALASQGNDFWLVEKKDRLFVIPSPKGQEERPGLLSWADEMEEEELANDSYFLTEFGVVPHRMREVFVKPIRVGSDKEKEHPATMANDGRPPPTAQKWGPDRIPQAPREPKPIGGQAPRSRTVRRKAYLEDFAEEADYEGDLDAEVEWSDHGSDMY